VLHLTLRNIKQCTLISFSTVLLFSFTGFISFAYFHCVLITMSADSLTGTSRAFYEQTRMKMVASLFLGSMACLGLAYCSSYGGISNSAGYNVKRYSDTIKDDDLLEQSEQALAGGYGKKTFLCCVV
jgi:hypothetical protein